jgi:hypothetical protein
MGAANTGEVIQMTRLTSGWPEDFVFEGQPNQIYPKLDNTYLLKINFIIHHNNRLNIDRTYNN